MQTQRKGMQTQRNGNVMKQKTLHERSSTQTQTETASNANGNGVERKQNGNITCAFIDLVSFK